MLRLSLLVPGALCVCAFSAATTKNSFCGNVVDAFGSLWYAGGMVPGSLLMAMSSSPIFISPIVVPLLLPSLFPDAAALHSVAFLVGTAEHRSECVIVLWRRHTRGHFGLRRRSGRARRERKREREQKAAK